MELLTLCATESLVFDALILKKILKKMLHNTYMSKTYINDNINHKITHSFAGRDREQSFSTAAMTQQGIEMEKNKLHKKRVLQQKQMKFKVSKLRSLTQKKGAAFSKNYMQNCFIIGKMILQTRWASTFKSLVLQLKTFPLVRHHPTTHYDAYLL